MSILIVLHCPLCSSRQAELKKKNLPTLPTMQPLSDITGGYLSDYMQLLLEPQKALYYFFHICSSTQGQRPVNTL